jgi:hypothetical protein
MVGPNTPLQSNSDIEDGDRIRTFWTSGAVHMNGEGYKCLAINVGDNILEGKVSRPTEAKASAQKRYVPDRAAAREDWVSNDDTADMRTEAASIGVEAVEASRGVAEDGGEKEEVLLRTISRGPCHIKHCNTVYNNVKCIVYLAMQ